MKYTETELEAIKRDCRLSEILPSLGFKLSKRGSNLVTLCPFHEDKDPSLIITPSNNLWHCMGCDAGGSVIDFTMKHQNLSFLAAVAQLKGKTSVVSAPSAVKKASSRRVPKAKLLERVACFYQKCFQEDQRGVEYLKRRGISDPSLLEVFRIGFCNGTLYKAIPEEGEVIDHLKEIGILQENGRESFENSVVFPILNESGVVVSFYARKIHDDLFIKHLYLSGPRRGLFNGQSLKAYPEIILTESIIDSLSLYQAGVKNTVPCFGVNGFTEYHLEQVKKHKTQDIQVIFDNDDSGRNGAIALKQKLQDHLLSCEVKELPEAHDINDFLVRHGEEALHGVAATKRKKILNALKPEMVEDGFMLKFCDRKYIIRGVDSSATRLKANVKAQNCTRFHIDTFDLYSSKSRRSFVREASMLFGEEAEIIENDLIGLIGQVEQYAKTRTDKTDQSVSMTDQERAEALTFGKAPDLVEKILKDIELLGYLGESTNKLLCYLAMTSRKMSDPMSVMVLSASGAGKSALQDTVLSLCPEEDLMKFTTLTERALFYKEPGSLKHKVMALAEEAGAEDAAYAIRNLISSKELTIEATVKDHLTGRMTTMKNTVKGPTSVFKTTTNPETDAETRSRFFILTVDESREQTRRVLAYQREMMTFEGFMVKGKRDGILRKHRNFQRLLRPVAVFNPFARLLTYQDSKLWVRRDNPKYLQLINSIAFLHQLGRPLKRKNGVEYIEVTLEDIALANELAGEILGHSLDDLSTTGRRLLEVIEGLSEVRRKEKKIEKPRLTRREIREASGWGETYVRNILRELVRMDYLVPVRGALRRSHVYELGERSNGRETLLSRLANVEILKEKAKKLGIPQ
jgi:DNA primase catalytic core